MQATEHVDTNNLGAAGRPMRHIDEICRLGREIYERDIRPQVEPAHDGEVVAIDVETGNWAMGENITEASGLLQAQHPDANDIWLERIGYLVMASFGGQPLLRRPE